MSLPTSQQIALVGVQVWDIEISENINRMASSTAQRIVECKWSDRIKLIQNLNGGAGTTSGIYFYSPGATYPYYGGLLYFKSARVHGIATGGSGLSQDTTISDASSAPVAYDRARVTIDYGTLPFIDGPATGTFSVDYGVEEVMLPKIKDGSGNDINSWVWADDGSPIDNDNVPTFHIVITDITWTQFNLASIPNTLLQGAAGCVNSKPFWGAKPGTILFCGAKSNRRMSAFGAEQYDLTEKFQHNPFGWNNKFRGDYGTIQGDGTPQSIYDFFRPIVTKQIVGGGPFAGGASPFPWADLNQLLSNEQPTGFQSFPIQTGF